jgi:hypothetical protein
LNRGLALILAVGVAAVLMTPLLGGKPVWASSFTTPATVNGQNGVDAPVSGSPSDGNPGSVYTYKPSSDETYDTFELLGGKGGDGGNGGGTSNTVDATDGGAGAVATYDGGTTYPVTVNGDTNIKGGNSGSGGTPPNGGGEAGDGAAGGDAIFKGSSLIVADGNLVVSAGTKGTAGGASASTTVGNATVTIKGKTTATVTEKIGQIEVSRNFDANSNDGIVTITVAGGARGLAPFQDGGEARIAVAGNITVSSGDDAAKKLTLTATGSNGGPNTGYGGSATISAGGALNITNAGGTTKVTATGGTAATDSGNGGSATVKGKGITITSNGDSTEATTVSALATAATGNGNGGSALIDSTDGILKVTYEGSTGTGAVTVSAKGQAAKGTGTAGTAEILAAGISLDNSAGNTGSAITLEAEYAAGEKVGKASIDATVGADPEISGYGVIKANSGADDITVRAKANDSTVGHGADAEIKAKGIDLTLKGAGSVNIIAEAGSGAGASGNNGGDATVDSTGGQIKITADAGATGNVAITATGKQTTSATAEGGAAQVLSNGIDIDNTGTGTTTTVEIKATSGRGPIVGTATINALADPDATGAITIKSGSGKVDIIADAATASASTVGNGAKAEIGSNGIRITVKGAGDVTVSARAGGTVTTGDVDGGDAIIDAGGAAIDVQYDGASVTGNVTIIALAGSTYSMDAGSKGGDGKIISTGIKADNSAATTLAGTITIIAGGEAIGETGGAGIIDAKTGSIEATAATQEVFIKASGAPAEAGTNYAVGGSGTITAKGGINAKSIGTYDVTVHAVSGGVAAGSTNSKVGDALIDVGSGTLSVTTTSSGKATVLAYTDSSSVSNAGAATILAGNVNIDSTDATGAAGVATVKAISTLASGKGAVATVNASGDVSVKSGLANAVLEVRASRNGASTNGVGTDATLNANSLIIQATKAADATVTLTAGAASGTANKGGDAVVDVKGDLEILGADDLTSGTGKASLDLAKGADAGSPTEGSKATVKVANNATLKGGDNYSNGPGGAVSLTADDVTVGNTLEATSGTGTGSNVTFRAATLTAPKININRNTGAMSFEVTQDLTVDKDTEITLGGSTGTAAADVSIAQASVSKGARLTINNAKGALTIVNLEFADKGTLYVAKSDNLKLTNLDAQNAAVTFELPDNMDKSKPFVEVSGVADFTGGTIQIDDDGSGLNPGDTIILVKTAIANNLKGVTAQTVVSSNGDIDNTYALTDDGSGNYISTLTSSSGGARSKSYSEGVAANLAFLTSGSDLVADTGTAKAVLAAQGAPGPAAFSAFSYGHSRYETGSHVDVDSFNLLLGVSYRFESSSADITLGAFFEYGNGNYDTYNSFPDRDYRGDGDVGYAGGGVLTRIEFAKSDAGSTYADLSVRFGRSANDFTLENNGPKYDFDSNYFGLNVGLGHVFNITATTSLDIYAKYLWTHQKGKDVRINTGTVIRFDDVNSHRIRAGLRVAFQATDFIKPYIGAAYEYEADGRAHAMIGNAIIQSPELKGSTGIGELGLSVNIGSAVNLDFGVQGYVGKRKGVTGTVVLNLEF